MKLLPGLNLSFSWKRAVGLTQLRTRIAKTIGVPTTRDGLERKIGRTIVNLFTGGKK